MKTINGYTNTTNKDDALTAWDVVSACRMAKRLVEMFNKPIEEPVELTAEEYSRIRWYLGPYLESDDGGLSIYGVRIIVK